MKIYEAIFDESKVDGVYALSVVENPAMEDFWIALSEHPQRVEFATVDEEKRLLLGASLIPNKKIYRNIDGNEFFITFSEKTIEKLAHSFIKNGFQNNSSLNHEVKLEGMSVVEAWTVNDPKNDKSNSYGKEYERGTWVTMMKVENDEIWNKVKKGEIKGFSIDAVLNLQELNLKPEIKMSNETNNETIVDSIVEKLKAFFSTEKKVDIKAEEDVPAPAPAPEDSPAEMTMDDLKKELSEMMSEMFAKLEERIAGVEMQLKEKDTKIEDLETELSKQPETKPINLNAEPEVVVNLTTKGSILELIRKNKN